FEDLDIPLDVATRYGSLSEPVPVDTVIFRETPAGGLLDFHTAPRRQFVITLRGLVEVECGNGDTRRFGPGDILLADVTNRQGHITHEIERPRHSIFVPLPEDLDLTAWSSRPAA